MFNLASYNLFSRGGKLAAFGILGRGGRSALAGGGGGVSPAPPSLDETLMLLWACVCMYL